MMPTVFQTLKELKPGDEGIILQVGGAGALKRRLVDMGMTPGTRVMVRKVAPLGDPMEIQLRNYILTLRKAEAERIVIKKCGRWGRGYRNQHRFGWQS